MIRRVRWSAVFLAVSLPALAAPAAVAVDAPLVPAEVRWPGEGGRRIDVALGLFLVDFARVNLREESFDLAGYLDTSWTDPSLALRTNEPRKDVRRFRPGQVWSPALEFVNAVEQVNAERDGDLYVSADGRTTQRVRFSHKFSSPFDLRRFPFDRQKLRVVVAPFDPFARDLNLTVDAAHVGQLEEAFVTDWDIHGVSAHGEPIPGGDAKGRRFVFEVSIHRRSTFYIYRVLVPMTLLVMASWSVFWFEPNNLQPQISTGLAILLSFVTFNYAIDFSMPKVAYLTYIDHYTLTSFAFVVAVTFAVAVVHVLLQRGREAQALHFQRVARWAFPVSFLAAVLVQTALAFR